MICPLRSDQQKLFSKVCSFEHVFGSRALASLQLYGLTDTRHSFYLSLDAAGRPDAALHLNGDVLTIVTIGGPPIEELAAFVKQKGAVEIDSTLEQDTRLQKILGGEIESSFFMEYPFSEPPAVPDGEIALTQDAKAVYQVLCRSHEYYRDHLEYEPWAADLEKRWQAGAAQTILLTENGCPVATGSVISSDAEAGAVAAVAVVPECRGRGLGSTVSAWLTAHIVKQGKRPVLISGYDEVAELYHRLGYQATDRWGELYL